MLYAAIRKRGQSDLVFPSFYSLRKPPPPFPPRLLVLFLLQSRRWLYHVIGWGPGIVSAVVIAFSSHQGPSLNCHCWLREQQGSVPRILLVSYLAPVAAALVLTTLVTALVSRAFSGGGLAETAPMRRHMLAQIRALSVLYGLYWAAVLTLYLVHARHVAQHGLRSPALVHAYAIVRALNGPVALLAWAASRPSSFAALSAVCRNKTVRWGNEERKKVKARSERTAAGSAAYLRRARPFHSGPTITTRSTPCGLFFFRRKLRATSSSLSRQKPTIH